MRHSHICSPDGRWRGRGQIRYDIPPGGSGASPGGKRKLIRREGSAARISDRTRPQDPGGREAQHASSRPVLQPTSQPVVLRSDEVGVSAMSVDATQR